ncbi:MAG: hypothetical protein ABL949_03205 [Fimbriimonadaceae bacterium]
MTRNKKIFLWIIVPLILIAITIEATVTWSGVFSLFRNGFAQALVKPKKEEYEGSTEENIKALRTALLLYHDNEDQFPDASGWMDAIKNQLKSNNLKPDEELKKFKVDGVGPTEYGFAFTASASKKNKSELKPDEVLVYVSKDRVWNAHGKPNEQGSGLAITVDGKILRIGS